MHTREMAESEGTFRGDWKPTRAENPRFKCRKCGSDDVWYRVWDSDDGGFEDVEYECRGCGRKWWFEGSDA
jgi:DNA-directed RNA polymerase subunit M/transcription elongation factor TFIIS